MSQNGALPQLLDCKALRAELGVTRAAAETIMRRLDTVQIEDFKKVTRALEPDRPETN